MDKERRETAHHEAAHAVVYFWSDVPFRKVTIKPDKKSDSLGHVALHRTPRWMCEPVGSTEETRSRSRIEAEVVALYAGQLAQARLTGKHPEDGHWKDAHDAVTLAYRLFSNTDVVNAFLHFCYLHAREWIYAQTHWVEIQAVAEALLERETLTRNQVSQVIADIPHDRFQLSP